METTRKLAESAPGYFAVPNHITPTPRVPASRQWDGSQLIHNPMQEMWDNFGDGSFELDHGVDEIHKSAHEKFTANAHEYGLWGAYETEPGDINDVEQLLDEENQDDLLSELLEQIGVSPDPHSADVR